MPIIIPPTEEKNFGEYEPIFGSLWREAEARLGEAPRLVIVGYSFPRTDAHAFSLLRAFLASSRSGKVIEIVDPFPSGVHSRVSACVAGRCNVVVHEKTLAEFLSIPAVELAEAESEVVRVASAEELGEGTPATQREEYVLSMLLLCNLHKLYFDLITLDGRRFLNARLPGEFATHLQGAHRPEVLDYRLNTIPIQPEQGPKVELALTDIWTVHPLGTQPLTTVDVAAVDTSDVDEGLRTMIRSAYNCDDDSELEYFLRRFLAS